MCAPSYCKWYGLASGGLALIEEMQINGRYLDIDDDDDNEVGAVRQGE